MHGKTFDHRPVQTGPSDLVLASLDGVPWPNFTGVVGMQRGDHACRAGLSNMGQCDRVFRTVPSPGLFQFQSPLGVMGHGPECAFLIECRQRCSSSDLEPV